LFKRDRFAPLLKWRSGPLAAVALALLLCGITLLMRLTFDRYFQVPAIFIFGPAVVLSTVFGGLVGGLTALALSTLASWYFFLQPLYSWSLTADNVTALVVFVLVFGADVALIEIVIRAYQSIQNERRRMSVALHAANMGLWRGDAATGRRQWSKEAMELFDYDSEADPRRITAITDFIHPDDRDRYRSTMARVIADPTCDEYDVEYRIVRRNGEVRWLRSRARISRNADGTAEWLDGGVMDITRQKNTERRLELLLFELQHRIRNFHAVVQAIANRTLTGDGAMKSSRDVFLDRLMALSRANIMLVHQEQAGLWLSEVAKEELGAFIEQIEIDGCAILLRPNVAQSFALVVHELATNAVKYGALSSANGRVHLRGEVESGTDAGKPRYHFSWRETGGAATMPTGREGYGRSLLSNLCEGLGQATWTLAADGLRFDLVCDLAILVPPRPAPTTGSRRAAGLAR
jgi:PAS domain S-box-containing protein